MCKIDWKAVVRLNRPFIEIANQKVEKAFGWLYVDWGILWQCLVSAPNSTQ